MARKRYSDEEALKLLREIDVHLHDGLDVVSACRKAEMFVCWDNLVEAGRAPLKLSGMTKHNPFRYFKINPEDTRQRLDRLV